MTVNRTSRFANRMSHYVQPTSLFAPGSLYRSTNFPSMFIFHWACQSDIRQCLLVLVVEAIEWKPKALLAVITHNLLKHPTASEKRLFHVGALTSNLLLRTVYSQNPPASKMLRRCLNTPLVCNRACNESRTSSSTSSDFSMTYSNLLSSAMNAFGNTVVPVRNGRKKTWRLSKQPSPGHLVRLGFQLSFY